MMGVGRKTESRLWDALIEGDVAAAQTLVQQEPDVAHSVIPKRLCKRYEHAPWGAAPLHVAAASGSVALVRALLTAGADLEAMTDAARTPLHCAAGGGQRSVVKLLLSQDAAVDATDEHERTPLHAAAGRGHDASAVVLLEAGADRCAADMDGNTPLHAAVAGGCEQAVASLLRDGAGIDARNQRHRTPLHVAIINEDHSVFSRVDPDRQNKRQLMERIARTLLEHQADPNAVDNTGATPLDLFEFLEGDRDTDPLVKQLKAYGGHWLRYEHRHAGAAPASAAESETMGGYEPQPPKKRRQRRTAAAGHAGETHPEGEGEDWPDHDGHAGRAPAGQPMPLGRQGALIGRSHECDMRYKSRTLSRRHARISFQGGEYVIEDVGSRNGIVVNDHKLAGPHSLTAGEVITLGIYEFEFDGHNLIPLTRELSKRELEAEGAR